MTRCSCACSASAATLVPLCWATCWRGHRVRCLPRGDLSGQWLSERLSSLHWDEEGWPLLFNLYRHREGRLFQRARDRRLRAVGATPATAEGHLALRRGRSATDEWRLALLHRATDLTPQELAVCLHLLRG